MTLGAKAAVTVPKRTILPKQLGQSNSRWLQALVDWRLLLSIDMRLVFGYQKSLELLTRGGFASTSIAQNRLHFFQQQEPLCSLSRKVQRKVNKVSELGTRFNVFATNVLCKVLQINPFELTSVLGPLHRWISQAWSSG